MEQNPFAPDFKSLPETLPVFPLSSALLLPLGNLPLNIFEPRYIQMIEDAMSSHRLIGMIQPIQDQKDQNVPSLNKIGCAGKITAFTETQDGRFEITLSGTYRFNIEEELETTRLYRIVKPDWKAYQDDSVAHKCLDLNRDKLTDLLKSYFKQHEMNCDWHKVESAPDGRLITCLSMVCPFEPKEKQALLEAPCCKTRAEMFMTMLEIAVHDGKAPRTSCQ